METVNFTAPVNSWDNNVDTSRKETHKIALIDADRYKHVVTYKMYDKIVNQGIPYSEYLLNEVIDEYLSNDIFNRFSAKAYIFCFSAPSDRTFRNHIAQEKKYKGQRKSKEDKYFYTGKYEDMGNIFNYINNRYETLFFDDLEADDLLSMLQCDETFIFSHDKDLKQVPGFHWDMSKLDWFYVSEDKGLNSLLCQVLLGDSTDNFGGLKNFGKKGLIKVLDELTNINVDFSSVDVNKLSIDDVLSRYPKFNPELLYYKVIKLFSDKHGLLEGIDTFNEMWGLASMKINRGDYLREKYASAFQLLKTLNEVEIK